MANKTQLTVKVCDFQIDLADLIQHADAETATILEAVARSVDNDDLEHSDVIASMIRDTAKRVKEIDDSIANESIIPQGLDSEEIL